MAVETNDTAKNWLASNAGVGNCFATSGVSYFTVEGDPKTGGTFIVLTFLQTAGLLEATKNNIIVNGKSYNDYLSETGETGITDADILWVAAHDEPSDSPPNPYCVGVTPPPTGKGTLYLGTDPYCCNAWIDADPAVDPPTVACTKDKTISPGYDAILLDAPATHTLHVRKTGYEDFYTEFDLIGEGDSWFEMMDPMKPLAGTDVAMLTVNAYKEEEKPAKVPIDNAVLKKGTSKIGFCPYSDYWRAGPGGTNYNISVVAEGRATHEESIVLYKDTPKIIDAYLPEKRLAVIIKIAAGLAYIDDISGGDYQIWYIGTKIEGWVRIETFIDKPTMFKAELALCAPGTTTPVAGISKIITEAKLLHPSMSASDRHLDWPPWLVPDRPGEYSLVAELFMMTT